MVACVCFLPVLGNTHVHPLHGVAQVEPTTKNFHIKSDSAAAVLINVSATLLGNYARAKLMVCSLPDARWQGCGNDGMGGLGQSSVAGRGGGGGKGIIRAEEEEEEDMTVVAVVAEWQEEQAIAVDRIGVDM